MNAVTRTVERIEQFFGELGFSTESGPEIEDAFHNFDALNIADDHPARTDHDAFFFNHPDLMLRTHTSGVQIRTMENGKPPFRFIARVVFTVTTTIKLTRQCSTKWKVC